MVLAVSDVFRYLVFPVVVLAAGAAFTGLLIPRLARRREDRRKELAVRTRLVTEMSEVVISFVTAIEFQVRGLPSQSSEEYDQAYKAWERQRAVLGTKLEAYFPNPGMKEDWRAFVKRVRDSYELTRICNEEKRKEQAIPLLKEYGHEWPRPDRGSLREWEEAWNLLREDILEMKGKLINAVMETDIRLG